MRSEYKRDRQYKVLEMIIKHHTQTAEPIGSRILSEDLQVSSATIRHVMFELEEMGLIRQPHTSAGRVPTDKGYRIYVDLIMKAKEMAKFDIGPVDDALSYLEPLSVEDVVLKGIELCSNRTSQACLATLSANKLYFSGASRLVEQPEFMDAGKIGAVLRILEDKRHLLEFLEEDSKEDGVKAHIGSENSPLGFEECALITANYTVKGFAGTLGVIGPMRMEYDNIIPTVWRIAGSLSRFFNDIL